MVEVRLAAAVLFANWNWTVPFAVALIIIWSVKVRGVFAPSVPSAIAVRLVAAEMRMPVERLIRSAVVLSPT